MQRKLGAARRRFTASWCAVSMDTMGAAMNRQSRPSLVSSLRSFSKAASAAAVVVGCAVVAGWLFDVAILRRFAPSWHPMRANAGVAFILLGVSAWLLQERSGYPLGRTRRSVAQGAAAVAAALGLATLLEFVFGWDLGIDVLLLTKPVDIPGVVHPERMGPNTALSSFLLGCGLVILDVETRSRVRPAPFFVLATGLIALLACVGHIYGATFLSGIEPYAITSENGAIMFLVLSAGVLSARPERGVMEILTSDGPGGIAARRLLPLFIGLTVLIGWIVLLGSREGVYSRESALSVLAVCVIVVFIPIVLSTSRSLHRAYVARHQAEEALRESEERYRTVADYTYDWEFWLGPDAKLIYVSPSCERITGHDPSVFLDDPALMGKIVHPDDRKLWDDHFRESLESREVLRVDFRIVRPDGEERWIGHICHPAYGADGRPLGRRASNRDITERKRAEEQIAELHEHLARRAALLQAANKELEAFSYSVSHDLRAPLRSVDGFSSALLEDYADKLDEQGRNHLERIRAASRRMAQLIDDLLKLSRLTRREMRREPVDLSALAQTIATELQNTEPERRVEFVIEPGLVADGDAHLLGIVLENLLNNAWKFTAKHPRATIEVGTTRRDGERAYFVRDDGAGFDPAYADKLFGVFQRLHPADEFAGAGIGLATVQRIVYRHGGRVWAEGEVEKGATFYFTLPA